MLPIDWQGGVKCHMFGGKLLRRTLTTMAASTVAAAIAILSTVRVAFAASTDARLPPEYDEMLRLAQQKVQAATQPGAFGNGIPFLNSINIDPASALPWIGIGAAAGIAAIVAAKLLSPDAKSTVFAAQ